MELEVAFGKTLREFRKQAHLSQEALALECDLDRTFISLLERGLRQPTLKTLFRLANVLNVSPSVLISAVESHLNS
ncbi:helix-turn-helix domain-containing protein [Geoalkalibacter halelectricus]|uniref:Helix-turn-helix domain-containing protein n=1 Tax=Geoalkalibacter halelectricus TaxID=2847045 RepID=A0ABY5ZK97_9BACT|nr:helix-turn-helix transcriptional regulator [Geoalkalibacter halelectricus]MDO3378103.1 helix-turn-helix domain-containing protein [Geoalkalibacter halelectricus]UWZ78397.1 helix-turn-helix domain-containing protein [Geoalkalibacter halelectricus]